MLEIRPTTDTKLLAAYCQKCGKTASPQFYLYLAKDGESLLGAGLFEIDGECAQPLLYEGDKTDVWLFDAVLRAGLNCAAMQGVATGCISEGFRAAHTTFFERLNYPAQPEFGLEDFFREHKGCAGV